jgi:hypothetical protein
VLQNALLLKWHQPQCTADVDESVTIWGPYPHPPKKPSLTIGARLLDRSAIADEHDATVQDL